MQKWIRGGWMVALSGVATAAAAATVVPLDMTTGRPVVEITAGTSRTLQMVLDTGATGSVVAAGVAEELGLAPVGRQLVGDPGGRGAHEVDRVALADVSLAGVPLGDVEAASLDLPAVPGPGGRPVDGVLGLRALDGHLVTLDLAAGELRLEPGGSLGPDDAGVVPYYLDRGLPWIQVTVGPLTVHAFLDTGNPGQLTMSEHLARHLELASEPVVVARGRTVSSTFEIRAAQLAGDVVVAGHVLSHPTIMFDGLHRGTEGNLGSGFLRQFVVTVDQQHHLLRLEPNGAAPAPLPHARSAGPDAG